MLFFDAVVGNPPYHKDGGGGIISYGGEWGRICIPRPAVCFYLFILISAYLS